jgi:hypothetical protein
MRKDLTALLLALFLVVALGACAPASVAAAAAPDSAVSTALPVNTDEIVTVSSNGATVVDPAALESAFSRLDIAALSEDEMTDLLFMREEEKLARDVYLALYAQWGLPIFQNIANSEQTHTGAIATLLARYDLDDPVLDEAVGTFANDDLQLLYDQLVAEGSESLLAALEVGATIEDLDIVDLQDAIARTDNADIGMVYQNLMKGSRNHLRSFVKLLQRQYGATYQPQYLDQLAFETIVNTPMERGRA